MSSKPTRDARADWTVGQPLSEPPSELPEPERPAATVVRLTPRDPLARRALETALRSAASLPLPAAGATRRLGGSFRPIWILNLVGALLALAAAGLADGLAPLLPLSGQALWWFLVGVAAGLLADSWSGRVAAGSLETARIGGLLGREALTAGALLMLTLSIVCLVLGCTAAVTGLLGAAA